MAYTYGMDESVMEFLEEFGYAFLGVLLGILLVVLVIGIVMYVFQSVGLYTIAKRRGIKNAWLAWIPVGYYWIAGSIADQYQYVVKGKVKNKRKILLGLSLGSMALTLIINVLSSILMTTAYDMESTLTISTMCGAVESLLSAGISITLVVFWQMALYDLYSSCCPENNVLFLVLGIVFGFTVPFFIFFNRKKDKGMPPRKPEPQAYIPQEPLDPQPRETGNGPELL